MADANSNLSVVYDSGTQAVNTDSQGQEEYAILEENVIGQGGWVPMNSVESLYNKEHGPEERIAICKYSYHGVSDPFDKRRLSLRLCVN